MLEGLIGEESDDSDFEVEKHKGRASKIITRLCKNPTRNNRCKLKGNYSIRIGIANRTAKLLW